MLLITKSDNLKISDMDYEKYSKDPDVKSILSTLGCIESKDINEFLANRFNNLEGNMNRVTLPELELSLQNGVNA